MSKLELIREYVPWLEPIIFNFIVPVVVSLLFVYFSVLLVSKIRHRDWYVSIAFTFGVFLPYIILIIIFGKGIYKLHLFEWVAETLLYRLNYVLLVFMSLMGNLFLLGREIKKEHADVSVSMYLIVAIVFAGMLLWNWV